LARAWSSSDIEMDEGGAASVRSLSAPDSAFDLNDLSQRSVIALVGLAFEARIAAGPGVLVVCRGRETADLLRLAIGAGYRSIISFGVAGGLAPDLIPGDCVVASAIIDYPAVRPADPLWSRKLADMIPGARHGPIMGVNAVVSNPSDKRKLHASTRAVAVDMASHLVARLADAHGLAFAAVRVIIDPAHRAVPPAASLANGAGRQHGCQRHAAGDFGATLASLAADAARRRRHRRPCDPRPPTSHTRTELQLGMRRASWRSGFAPLAEPEPNKYAEIAPRNSRESIAIYATVDEINSSMVCDILKSSQN
jgi:adenosylhomocysteine nucleosidase